MRVNQKVNQVPNPVLTLLNMKDMSILQKLESSKVLPNRKKLILAALQPLLQIYPEQHSSSKTSQTATLQAQKSTSEEVKNHSQPKNQPSDQIQKINQPNFKVIIVGQDPYPIPGVATGLAFAVENETTVPPSLQIIQTELAVNYYNDITWYLKDTSLKHWEEQGVILLNASLTCDEYHPEGPEYLFKEGSHSNLWRTILMEDLFKWLNECFDEIVFVFMGRKAQYYSKFITNASHKVLTTVHPVADFRTGNNVFIGSKIFNKINTELKNYGEKEISW